MAKPSMYPLIMRIKSYLAVCSLICLIVVAEMAAGCVGKPIDEDDPADNDTTPAKAMMAISLDFTDDMFELLNIELSVFDGVETKTFALEESMMGSNPHVWQTTLASDKLPATFFVSTEVTMKDEDLVPPPFTYTTGYVYQYALYNAAGKKVFSGTPYSKSGKQSASGIAAKSMIQSGRLNRFHRFSFDAEGNFTYGDK